MFHRHHTTCVPLVTVRHVSSSSHNMCSAGYPTSCFIVIMCSVGYCTSCFIVIMCSVGYCKSSFIVITQLTTNIHVSSSSHNMCSAGYRTSCFIVSTLQSRILPVTVMFHRHHTAYYLVFPWLPHDMFHYYHTTLSLCLFLHSALPRHHTEHKTHAMRTVRTTADETYLQTKGNKRRSNIKQKQQNVIMQPYIYMVKV